MIQPTIGRVVWYWPRSRMTQPHPAIVSFVYSDHLVNLAVFNDNGEHYNRTSVPLYQADPNEERPSEPFCEWMPYQKGQAAKTEKLEANLQKGNFSA